MVTSLLSLLVTILVVGLILYLIFWVMAKLGVPEPIKTVITVVCVVIVALWLLSNFLPHMPVWPH